MQKILVDNYTNLQGGAFECDCIGCDNQVVTIDEVYNHLGTWVTIDTGEGDSYEVRNTDYFCSLDISDTCSLFAEIINARQNRTELPDMPNVFEALGNIFSHFDNYTKSIIPKPDHTDMVQDMAHSHIVHPDSIS